ncbi:MAG: ankyrin repeat domain-containing protein [Verrucomicrobia bacterium]|nr:ankyrin repeat domain-containing protein [Verrucomicrobiota bacterium]
MKKYRVILIDTLLLCLVSTVLAYLVSTVVTKLKGKVTDDPIVTAIIQANAVEVERLVKGGSDVTNQTDALGRTALMRAAFANYSGPQPIAETDDKRVGIVELLLNHGAQPDRRDNDGWSALMWAAWSGLPKVADTLLRHGASTAFADRQGNTALIIAAQRGNAAIVKALLAKGAAHAVANKAGKTALEAATTGMQQYPEKRPGYEGILSQLKLAFPAATDLTPR